MLKNVAANRIPNLTDFDQRFAEISPRAFLAHPTGIHLRPCYYIQSVICQCRHCRVKFVYIMWRERFSDL